LLQAPHPVRPQVPHRERWIRVQPR